MASAYTTVLTAWAKTGLFPLREEVALSRDGSTTTGMWFNSNKQTTPIEIMGLVLPGKALDYSVDQGIVMSPAVAMSLGSDGNLVLEHASVHSNSNIHACAPVLRMAIAQSMLVTARSASECSKAAKAIKAGAQISMDAPMGDAHGQADVVFGKNGFPSTLEGLCVNDNTIKTMRAKVQEKKCLAETVQLKKDNKVVENAAKLAEAAQTAFLVQSAMLSGRHDWAKPFKAPLLATAANLLLQPAVKLSKREDCIAALDRWSAARARLASPEVSSPGDASMAGMDAQLAPATHAPHATHATLGLGSG